MRSFNLSAIGALLGIFALISSANLSAALPVAVGERKLPSLAPMLSRTTSAVVNIATRGSQQVRGNGLLDDPLLRRFFDLPDRPQERQTRSLGSGVIVDAKRGYILTNNHVIENAQTITVTLIDGREFTAKSIGVDPQSDVAVVQIPAEGLTAIPLANTDALRVGDFVVAIGNPFGLGQTVTSGIVSALGRSGLGIEDYEDFIQTDASINPGNSGGALVNLRGELVGINTAILGSSGNIGIGFAIPANMAEKIMEQLVEHGEVRRGRLGISAQDLSPELAQAFNLRTRTGVVIARVAPDSPAAHAGLRAGDVVTKINGRKVRGAASMRNLVGLLRVGQSIRMTVVREGREHKLEAVIEAPQENTIAGQVLSPRLDGALLANFVREQGYQAREGVVIAELEQGSPAWRAGLRQGDIILSANRHRVANIDELRRAVGQNPRALLLNVQRGRAALFVLLQ